LPLVKGIVLAFGPMDQTPPRRRLSDKILAAFEQACDRGELDVAELLVKALEVTLTRVGGHGQTDRRRDMTPLAEAFSRLDSLREQADSPRQQAAE